MKPTNRLIAQSHARLGAALEAMTQPRIDQFVRKIVPLVDRRLLTHSVLSSYFEAFESGVLIDKSMAVRLRMAAQEFDQDYFRMQEDGMPKEAWSEKFHQSRLASALAMIAEGASQSDLSEIVYEMAHAHDPPDQFFDRITDAL